MLRVSLAVAVALGLGAIARQASAEKTDAKGIEFFEAKIRPVLATSCVGCHGAEKQKAGLRLDTREGLLAGTNEDGKVKKIFDASNPEKSLVLEVLDYKGDNAMPPPKKGESRKLADDKIADVKAWVKMGVPYGAAPVVPAAPPAK